MKIQKIKAIKAEINDLGNKLIKTFQEFQGAEVVDKITGLNQEKTEDLGMTFEPVTQPKFNLNEEGLLILGDEHFNFSKYDLEFYSFSHLEKEDENYVLITLDGTRHVISTKSYKKLMGKSKTK